MAGTSHRKCQLQGEGCTGMAHAGHDQCAYCYFHYVKPALQAERLEVKGRRALKRQHLSPSNRALINDVDLKEPQIRPLNVTDAISTVLLDQEWQQAAADGIDPRWRAGEKIMEVALADVPVVIDRYEPPQKEEPTMPEPEPGPPLPRPKRRPVTPPPPRRKPPVPLLLTDEQRQEIIDAYVANMSTVEICAAYNINPPRLYDTLRKAGVPLRGREPTKTATQLPPIDHIPSLNGTTTAVLSEWTVTYTVRRTETKVMAAKSFNDAAFLVAEGVGGDVEIIGVAKVQP